MRQYISNKKLTDAFIDVGLIVDFSPGNWLNIARPDGMHCEFYPNDKTNYVFTATYTVKGKEKTFDFYMPDHLDYFVDIVCQILKHKKVA